MGDSSDMRISLPPGTVLRGQRSAYKVNNIICLSERSVTVSCFDGDNRERRLKLYNGDSSVTEETQVFLMKHAMQGVVLPTDIGEYSGLRFSVYEKINATSAESFPISIDVLMGKIIPQMAYLIDKYHKMNVLLRDICPSHILYKPDERKIAYCGFNNVAFLRGKASTTKEPGHGQEQSYIAPEVGKYGYSRSSDYFSFGTAILTMLKGDNPIEGIARKDFIEQLKIGRVPGIDVEHLRNTSFELYSSEDRVMYLVLGLLIPDPRNRWEYGEIRCWLNGQQIPLVQKGNRLKYQFNEPFVVGNTRCWNERQLAQALASTKTAWTESVFSDLLSFAKKQSMAATQELQEYKNDSSISSCGKIFRSIYAIDPHINGLWWKGIRYDDAEGIAKAIQNKRLSENIASTMLKDSVFSFFERTRSKYGSGNAVPINELVSIEASEAAEGGKGVQRFLMLFSGDVDSRYFEFDNNKYKSIYELLVKFKNDGKSLREKSPGLLRNQSFQAWLWAKGMEPSGREADRIAKEAPQQSMYFLLCLCEELEKDDSAKKLARSIFLKWGDFSPVVWLCSNVRYYNVVSETDRSLFDVFRNTKFKLDSTIDELSRVASNLVSDYQMFVTRTLDNPFVLENEKIDEFSYGYYPQYESGYFCCHWINGLEVCPAFLSSVGDSIDSGEIGKWLKEGEDDEVKRLNEKASVLPDFSNDSTDEGRYLSSCNKNIACSVLMVIVAVVLLILTRHYSFGLGIIAFVASVLFPVNSFFWYTQKKNRIELWTRNKQDIQYRHSFIEGKIKNIHKRNNEIYSGIVSRKQNKVKITDDGVNTAALTLDNPEALDLSTWQKVMAYLSSYGFVMMATIYLGNAYSSFLSVSIYAVIYGIGAPFLINRRRFVNSCFAWTITTLIVTGASLFGGMAYGSSFFVTMNWIPVVCLIVIAVLCIIMMFM